MRYAQLVTNGQITIVCHILHKNHFCSRKKKITIKGREKHTKQNIYLYIHTKRTAFNSRRSPKKKISDISFLRIEFGAIVRTFIYKKKVKWSDIIYYIFILTICVFNLIVCCYSSLNETYYCVHVHWCSSPLTLSIIFEKFEIIVQISSRKKVNSQCVPNFSLL